MKSIPSHVAAVAAASLVLCGSSLNAAQSDAREPVTFEDAMTCSTVFTLLATASAGTQDEDTLVNIAAQWMVAAMKRPSQQYEASEEELLGRVEALNDKLAGIADVAAREVALNNAVNRCAAKASLIPEEFDEDMGF